MFTLIPMEGVARAAARVRRRRIKLCILPALRRVLPSHGPLPERARLVSRFDAEVLGSLHGEVHLSYETTEEGVRVVAVGPVTLAMSLDVGDGFDRIAAHEFAHFHELEVRRRAGLLMPSRTASMVWSEYFAERTRWRAGFRHVGGFGHEDDAVDAQRLVDGEVDPLERAYVDACFIALAHEEPRLINRNLDPPALASTEALLRSPLSMALAGLFESFPRWSGSAHRSLLADATAESEPS